MGARPPRHRLTYAENRKRAAEGVRRYWAMERQVRGIQRAADVAVAAAEIGDLTDSEVLIAGAVAYWCEGTKRKSHHRIDRVVFVNSDAGLIRFFLRFLATAGVQRSDLAFCVYIHESADVEAAQRFWREATGASPDQFTRPALKRHNPKPIGKMSATATTDACAFPCAGTAICTAGSKAGLRRR